MKILYAGDSEVGGPANYLLAILKYLNTDFLHLAPSEILRPQSLSRQFDAIILSDFPAKNAPLVSQRLIAEQVSDGAGLLMIGGWGSFAGLYGRWQGSRIEEILPVTCRNHDDRMNFPGGALVIQKENHAMLRGLPFNHPPVICGLNRVMPKRNSLVHLVARKILCPPLNLTLSPKYGFSVLKRADKGTGSEGASPLVERVKQDGRKTRGEAPSEPVPLSFLSLHPLEHPLLVIDRDPAKRIAAFTTDLAPHWCGGWVDWGKRRLVLPVKEKIRVEVGEDYVRLLSGIVRWLVKR